MPNIGLYHPQIVHFVIALAFVGVGLRWVSLTGRFPFTREAAATLLILAAISGVVAAQAGDEAHERVEQIPGVAAQVHSHQEAGEDARDILLVVAGIEVVGLLLKRRNQWRRYVEIAAAVVGLGALGVIYVAGKRGGDLVYSYAGGPGLRTGDTLDVHRLLDAGLYNEAMVARHAHRGAEADSLITELAARNPGNVDMELVAAQSLLVDRHDPRAALAALDRITPPDSERFLKFRIAFIKVQAFEATDMKDSARAVMETLVKQFPNDARLKERLARMK